MPMAPEVEALYNRVMETQEQLAASLSALNSAPNVATPAPLQDVTSQATPPVPQKRVLSASDIYGVRQSLRKMSTPELFALFNEQARQKNTGVSLDNWLSAGGSATQMAFGNLGTQVEPDRKSVV